LLEQLPEPEAGHLHLQVHLQAPSPLYTVWGNFDIVPCIVVIIVAGRLLTLFRLSKKTRFDKILETNYFENETMQILS